MFAHGQPLTVAHGQLVHAYVNRATRRPTALPLALSQALQGLL